MKMELVTSKSKSSNILAKPIFALVKAKNVLNTLVYSIKKLGINQVFNNKGVDKYIVV